MTFLMSANWPETTIPIMNRRFNHLGIIADRSELTVSQVAPFPPRWRVAPNLRPMPENHGIGSLVLAPLADECGDYVWLLIRYRTQYPEPGRVEGDHLYTSSAEACLEATSQFGVEDSEWKVLPTSDVLWIDKEIR